MTNLERRPIQLTGITKSERTRLSLRVGQAFARGPARLVHATKSGYLAPYLQIWRLTEWEGPKDSYTLYLSPSSTPSDRWIARTSTWDFARTKLDAIRDSKIETNAFTSSLFTLLLPADMVEAKVSRLVADLRQLPTAMDDLADSTLQVLYGFEYLGDAASVEAEWRRSELRLDKRFERLWEAIERAPKRRVRKWAEDYWDLDPVARRIVNQIERGKS